MLLRRNMVFPNFVFNINTISFYLDFMSDIEHWNRVHSTPYRLLLFLGSLYPRKFCVYRIVEWNDSCSFMILY